MVYLENHEGGMRLSGEKMFFDTTQVYNLEDWLFRLNCYYEMLRATLGPELMAAEKERVEELYNVLNLMIWARGLPAGVIIGYLTDENGGHVPYVTVPGMRDEAEAVKDKPNLLLS